MNSSWSSDPVKPLLLDGGLGRELMARGVVLPPHVWAAEAVLSAPDVVLEVHTAYVFAGADVITTATYGLNTASLLERGASADWAHDLCVRAGKLARSAVGSHSVRVAGSIGPAGPSYCPDRLPPAEEVRDHFLRRALALKEGGVDLLLAETLSSSVEALAALEAGAHVGLPIWIAFSPSDEGDLLTGEPLSTVVATLSSAECILLNCATPSAIARGLSALAASPRARGRPLRLGAYPNALAPRSSCYDYETCGPRPRTGLHADQFVLLCLDWVTRGASVVGGCCGIGPEEISALRRGLDDLGRGGAPAPADPIRSPP